MGPAAVGDGSGPGVRGVLQGYFVEGETVLVFDASELFADHLGSGPVGGITGHRCLDHRAHVAGVAPFPQVGDGLLGDAEELRDDLLTAAAFEGRMSGQRAEQGGAQSVDVGGSARCARTDHLGCGERRRPGDRAGRGFESAGEVGDAEVGQRGVVVVGDQDVARLDIAVQHIGSMRGRQRTGDLHAQTQHLRQRQRAVASDAGIERTARVIGHHQVGATGGGLADFEHARDIGMARQPPHGPLLAKEALPILVQFGGQYFDRDGAIHGELGAPIHLPETTPARSLRHPRNPQRPVP